MQRIELDGRKMDTRALAHQYLKAQLDLPAHYGANLDALHDCLGEMESAHITLRYADALRNALGAYGQQLIQVLTDSASERNDLVVAVKNR